MRPIVPVRKDAQDRIAVAVAISVDVDAHGRIEDAVSVPVARESERLSQTAIPAEITPNAVAEGVRTGRIIIRHQDELRPAVPARIEHTDAGPLSLVAHARI